MTEKDQRWAVFWCGLLHPILFGQVPPEERNAFLRKLTEIEVPFPDGTTRKPSLSTLKRKLKIYETEGFDRLARKTRRDRGRPRAHLQEVIEKAIQLKKDQPKRCAETINLFLKTLFGKTIPRSTLYGYLNDAGATKLKLGVLDKPVRCRWTVQKTHDLWLGDFSHGPWVLEDGHLVPTRLSAFIDCHSRYSVSARYYLSETFDILIDSLLRAWDIHGAPHKLYLDNAKVYHASRLYAACYALHIEIWHRPVNDPSPGGLIERFIQTVQDQFEAEVKARDETQHLSLIELNRAFSAWLEVVYHQRVHSETCQTPERRYHAGLKATRQVDLPSVLRYFMETYKRTVHKDFSDVRIENLFFRVDPKLRGDKVLVRFDPYGDKQTVLIYSLEDQFLGKGIRYHREKTSQPPHTPSSKKAQHDFLSLWVDQHDKRLHDQAQGIDFVKLSQAPSWSFPAFVKSLAQLMGLKGGITAFSSYQLDLIKKTFDAHPSLDKNLLLKAMERVPDPSCLPAILFQIKILAQSQNPKE
jgi:transposase InsO family protein